MTDIFIGVRNWIRALEIIVNLAFQQDQISYFYLFNHSLQKQTLKM